MDLNGLQREHSQPIVLGGNGVSVALATGALAVDCAAMLSCPKRRTLAVATREVGSEYEDRAGR